MRQFNYLYELAKPEPDPSEVCLCQPHLTLISVQVNRNMRQKSFSVFLSVERVMCDFSDYEEKMTLLCIFIVNCVVEFTISHITRMQGATPA